jgi:hypothetical protein
VTPEEKATCARQLQENPLFVEMFREMEEELKCLWEGTRWEEKELREFQWQMLKALRLMIGRVNKYVADESVEMKMKEMKEQYETPGVPNEGEE